MFRLYGSFFLVGFTCILFMTTGAHAAEPTDKPLEPAANTSQQEKSAPKKQTSNDAKKDAFSETVDPARVREEIDAIRTDNSLPDEMRARCQEILTTTLKDIESLGWRGR